MRVPPAAGTDRGAKNRARLPFQPSRARRIGTTAVSNDAMSWAWRQTLKAGPKFVLIALADYADENWSCFPGVPTIAQRVGTGESTVRDNIARLVESGHIIVERRHRAGGSRSSNRYVLCHDRQEPESGGGSQEPESGGGKSQNPADLQPESGGATNPQVNPQTEPSGSPLVAPQALAADPFERAWKVWPRGENKKLARERFERAVSRKRISAEDLATAIARHGTVYAAWPESEQEYVPHLSSWLSRERWNDPEPRPKRGQADRNVVDQGRRVYEQLLAEEAAKREAATRGLT